MGEEYWSTEAVTEACISRYLRETYEGEIYRDLCQWKGCEVEEDLCEACEDCGVECVMRKEAVYRQGSLCPNLRR